MDHDRPGSRQDGCMSLPRRRWPLLVLLGLLGTYGCTSTPSAAKERPPVTASTGRPPTAAAGPAATSPAAQTPGQPNPVSLQALMGKQYDGRGLRLGRVLDRTTAYTRYFVTYLSGDLTISGVMNVPRGPGPFPVLVLCHGYIDPKVYRNGQGLAREQGYLARRGYVVLHTDYRTYAQSDDDPANEVRLRLGYTEDVINAVLAVKGSALRYLDRERVGLLGRSMGGGVVLNTLVVKPGLVDAAVLYSSVSADAVDNFDRWTRGQPGQRQLTGRIIAAYGSPERNPAFWRNLSASSFLDRVSEPVLIHHGTADETCPIAWSRRTFAALRGLHKDATFFTYPGEQHAFGAAWPTSMRRTVAFFARHLRA
jgi:dipeptidyl aminopeptidase/acylaminoacyl peptidase